jgi:hypothetical protein
MNHPGLVPTGETIPALAYYPLCANARVLTAFGNTTRKSWRQRRQIPSFCLGKWHRRHSNPRADEVKILTCFLPLDTTTNHCPLVRIHTVSAMCSKMLGISDEKPPGLRHPCLVFLYVQKSFTYPFHHYRLNCRYVAIISHITV